MNNSNGPRPGEGARTGRATQLDPTLQPVYDHLLALGATPEVRDYSTLTADCLACKDGCRMIVVGPTGGWCPHGCQDVSAMFGYQDQELARLKACLVDSVGLDGIPDPEPLIGEDILFQDSLAWLVGKPGCGKSFVALDMAGCVATGESWQGYKVQQGKVLYLVAEGVRGTKKRVRAWEKSMGRTMDGVSFLPLAVQAAVPSHWDALVALVTELRPTLMIIDTQARTSIGFNENDNSQMGRFVDQVERLRRAAACTVMIVHHIGRTGDTGRGATSLDGALETIIRVSKADNQLTLECQKNKDGEEWTNVVLRMVPMGDSLVLAVDEAGRRKSRKELLNNRWLGQWWKTFQGEPVSVSVLEKTDVVASSTFYRALVELLENGMVIKEGRGNATRYRLTFDPSTEVPG